MFSASTSQQCTGSPASSLQSNRLPTRRRVVNNLQVASFVEPAGIADDDHARRDADAAPDRRACRT
jgi:hypothetical protein